MSLPDSCISHGRLLALQFGNVNRFGFGYRRCTRLADPSNGSGEQSNCGGQAKVNRHDAKRAKQRKKVTRSRRHGNVFNA